MGSRISYSIKTRFDFLNKAHVYDFSCRIVNCFWSFFCSCTLCLFVSFFRHFFGFQKDKNIEKYESNSIEVIHQEDDKRTVSSGSMVSRIDQSDGEGENSVVTEAGLSASTNRCEFLAGKGVAGFVEQPSAMSFVVHELFLDSNNEAIISNTIFDTGGSTEEDFYDVGFDADKTEKEEKAEKTKDPVNSFMIDGELVEKQEKETSMEDIRNEEEVLVCDDDDGVAAYNGNHELDVEGKSLVTEETLENPEVETFTKKQDTDKNYSFEVEQDSSSQVQLIPKYQSFPSDVEEESVSSNDQLTSKKDESYSTACAPSDDGNLGEVFEHKSPVCLEEDMGEHNKEPDPIFNGIVDDTEHEAVLMGDQSSCDSDDEYIELQPMKQNSISLSKELLSKVVDEQEQQESVQEKAELKPDDDFERFEESSFKDEKSSKDVDYMFEHEDIIEQLKMELKLARTGGLPTIHEEPESEELETLKTVQELKPLKIDEKKFEHKDVLDGIQKVYKSYLDKMRKLDILNFQTMHALGLLQMKNSVQFQTARKSSVPSLLPQNLWLCKGSAVVDPLKKVIADMNRDFETIYVGHLSLSWEILHWQYCKVQELQKYDSQGTHIYNQVAGEFQLFQVLIQRFVENEQFQGPRVQNYVKNRCVLRSLLQVPLVKYDCVKEKRKRGDGDEDAITSQMLTGIVEQSMRVFWEFLRADKDESSMIFTGTLQVHPNLQEVVGLELLTDIRTDFQKKDKKLKDILRSGNCIVKKFKKQKEDGLHQTLLIAQVELKLISKVLNMPKLTTDQLIWCHEKLDKMNLCNRNVFVESSFLLFPC